MSPEDRIVAFEAAQEFRPLFCRLARKYVDNREDAEDVVQKAMLLAYRSLHQFRGDAKMSTWLSTVVINCARMHLRQNRVRNGRHIPVSDVGDYELFKSDFNRKWDVETLAARSESIEKLHHARRKLSPTLRRAIDLRLAEKSIQEIANTLNVPLGTVKARISRAKNKMRRHLCRGV